MYFSVSGPQCKWIPLHAWPGALYVVLQKVEKMQTVWDTLAGLKYTVLNWLYSHRRVVERARWFTSFRLLCCDRLSDSSLGKVHTPRATMGAVGLVHQGQDVATQHPCAPLRVPIYAATVSTRFT